MNYYQRIKISLIFVVLKFHMDPFVEKYLKENNLSLIDSNEDKPWGGYYIFEAGSNYDKKILRVKPEQYLSLQFHGTQDHPGHAETWIALTDFVIVLGSRSAVGLSDEEYQNELNSLKIIRVKQGDKIEIGSGFMHALVNPFDHDIYVQETRTSQFDESSDEREQNIVRIYDQTGRDGLPDWPNKIKNEIKNKAKN